jgi:hypothetical protein
MPHYFCNNPFLRLNEGIETVMYHSDSPRYFSCIRSLDLKNKIPVQYDTGPNFGFIHIAPDQQARLFFIIVDDNINRASPQKLQKIMQQQAQFFIDQFINEHYKDVEDKGKWLLLRDYNSFTPGLKIIHFKAHDTFLVSCEGGLHGCATEEDVFDFLEDILEYPEEQVEKGSFNVIDPTYKPSAQAL